MKNIFDAIVSDEREVYDGELFCTKRISLEREKEMDRATDAIGDIAEKAKLPWLLVGIEGLCGFVFLIAFRIGLEFIFDYGIKALFLQKFILVIVAVAAGAGFLLIWSLSKQRVKQVVESTENERAWDELDKLGQMIELEMDIPEENMEIDVLSEIYEIKKGVKRNICQPITMNGTATMYFRDNYLCLFDGGQEFSIPLRDIVKIEKLKKRMSIADWNKEDGYDSSKYLKYDIAPNNYGLLIKQYYSIQIQSIWGEFEIRMPEYEEEAVNIIREKMTHYAI